MQMSNADCFRFPCLSAALQLRIAPPMSHVADSTSHNLIKPDRRLGLVRWSRLLMIVISAPPNGPDALPYGLCSNARRITSTGTPYCNAIEQISALSDA